MRSSLGLSPELSWLCALLGILLGLGTSLAEEGKGRLELKKLTGQRQAVSERSGEFLYRITYPQHVFARLDEDRADPDFDRIVKRQPKYNFQRPIRRVVKLGGQEFAFAVDTKQKPNPEEEKEKNLDNEKKVEKAPRLDRLYFDLNHNGDLADDKPVDAESGVPFGMASFATFPRIDLTLQIAGKSFDYGFFLRVYTYSSRQMSYASASLTAAAYREGELLLGGERHKVALLDFNSNGRFDDEVQLDKQAVASSGALPPTFGDMLLLDPDKTEVGASGYDLFGVPNRHHVSKLVNLGGRYHELAVSATGEEISLRPVSLPLGRVATRHDGFEALLLGSQGAIQLIASKDQAAAVPEGEWQLLAYRITARSPEKKPADGAANEKPAESKSLWSAIASAVFGIGGEKAEPLGSSVVDATATASCRPIGVKKDQTATLAFGPPYRPEVKVQFVDTRTKQAYARLEMVLVGAGGEVCTNLRIGGQRPPDPKFTIRDASDKVVQQGTFKYG